MNNEKYVLDKVLQVQVIDENGKVVAEIEGSEGMPVRETTEKPIKIVYADDPNFEYDDEGNIVISRKATLSEIAAAFGFDEADLFKLGFWKLDEERED